MDGFTRGTAFQHGQKIFSQCFGALESPVGLHVVHVEAVPRARDAAGDRVDGLRFTAPARRCARIHERQRSKFFLD